MILFSDILGINTKETWSKDNKLKKKNILRLQHVHLTHTHAHTSSWYFLSSSATSLCAFSHSSFSFSCSRRYFSCYHGNRHMTYSTGQKRKTKLSAGGYVGRKNRGDQKEFQSELQSESVDDRNLSQCILLNLIYEGTEACKSCCNIWLHNISMWASFSMYFKYKTWLGGINECIL